ncbi:Dus-domain-containing protein [Polychaeton citri CBS 116435]|uniref:tRNA-dihydrouridine(16/17) synthase [NAD(P)(+)] n=1 Tax=Polychaeton citri CBS 116435 TaxID=1314669 RepID=A0A9P4Q773_9PEZI|nr:Dus-domain-containing protein [Polychaeton citri CBS 116435]
MANGNPSKLHGRAFYESIGSPKHIVAPMVDQSEFAWRLLTKSFLPPDLRRSILCYSPMFHARLFAETPKYREHHFTPLRPPAVLPTPADEDHQVVQKGHGEAWLDGNEKIGDRPLFVQFCANDPQFLLEAAKIVQPYCDAVDLNLGCPQGIAKKGHYGAFLQEDWDTIYKLINTLHNGLDIPVTAKMRILESKEKTLEYAKMILSAGASLITVHGRQREQKGHNTGVADWQVLRYLREQLPPETVMFANGNILQHNDVQSCLDATGVDGVMSAEGNLYDPAIFAAIPEDADSNPEYFIGIDGKGGWRMDAVLRRYMDILYTYVLGQESPKREPLFQVSDSAEHETHVEREAQRGKSSQKMQHANGDKWEQQHDANFVAIKAHLFHMLRPLVTRHHNVRDALARSKAGYMESYENVLTLTEQAVKEGLLDYHRNPGRFHSHEDITSSNEAVIRCKRPYFVCQPHVRPLPHEAIEKGSMQLSKREKAKLEKDEQDAHNVNLSPGGKIETHVVDKERVEIPKEGVVCG